MVSITSAAAPQLRSRLPTRLSHLGDELLARYAARGSDRAFAVLYERHHQPLYRYCRSILRHDHDAQDALQSTFTRALRALRRDQRNAPLKPWLFRIAHNEAITLLRGRKRQPSEELSGEEIALGLSTEQEVASRARWRTLVEDLAGLPERQRAALLLRELSGLSHEEIALALGTTPSASKQSIFEARQSLGMLEAGRDMSCEDVRRRISEGDRRVLRGRQVRAHLRACPACEAFALAIPARTAQLRALTPALAPVAAAALLSRSLAGGSAPGAGGAAGAPGLAAGAMGKASGTAMAWKALTGVVLIAGASAGMARLPHVLHPSTPVKRPAAMDRPAQAASGLAGAWATSGHGNRGAASTTPHLHGSSPAPAQPARNRSRHGASAATVAGTPRAQGGAGSSGAGASAVLPSTGSSARGHGGGASANAPARSNGAARRSQHAHRPSLSSPGQSRHSSGLGPVGHAPTSAGQSTAHQQTGPPTKVLTLGPAPRSSAVGTQRPSR